MNIGDTAILSKPNSLVIGVIAEDGSDVEVSKEIFSKYAGNSRFSVKKFVGSGCGRLRNKCKAWTEALFHRGCHYVIVLHDRDRHDEAKLRRELEAKVGVHNANKAIIVIPVEELEAWLLSDESAIKVALSLQKMPKRIADVESVTSPKETLGKIIYSVGNRRYVNTIHNKRIAERVSLANLQRCPSFLPLHNFLSGQVFKKKEA